MHVRLFCDGVEAPVSPFIGRFVANVCLGITASLKTQAAEKQIRYELSGDDVKLSIDGTPVPLGMSQGFARTVIQDTLQGMVRSLKGMDPQRHLQITVELDNQS